MVALVLHSQQLFSRRKSTLGDLATRLRTKQVDDFRGVAAVQGPEDYNLAQDARALANCHYELMAKQRDRAKARTL